MLDRDTRAAILTLHERGCSARKIAKSLKISRNTVKCVLKSGEPTVPALERAEQLGEHLALVRELHHQCGGNRVRVHEELAAKGITVAYPTLTAFCRRHQIGVREKEPAGAYTFKPGEEMQHDTSPHDVTLGGRKRILQCASLILCYSRKQYAQVYERWARFEARVFISEAIEYLGGAADRCMLDNSSVIMIGGTGKHARPAAAMKATADRFGFTFVAHELGDVNRSARVERPFHHIENNFYAGRTFVDLADVNRQLRQWCDRNNARYRKRLGASPLELFVAEAPTLKPLPIHIPEVYDLHRRRVDVEGYVALHTNYYSVDAALIHRHVEIRETKDRVRVFDGHRLVCEHAKAPHGARARQRLEEHRRQPRRRGPRGPMPEREALLRGQSDAFNEFVDALQRRYGGRAVRAVRWLHRIWTDYPTPAVEMAVTTALEFELTDLNRLERMVLRRIAGDFFNLPHSEPEDNTDG